MVSFVLATHDRRDAVIHTLDQLEQCGLDRCDYEIIVVDNASTDGTWDAIADRVDLLLRRRGNDGSCAKAFGVERASGQYIVFLDDDSFPRPGTTQRMIQRFEQDPGLGAAGCTVHLPDGKLEGGALPDVFVGCGVGFRAAALRAAGNLDRTFFMQAEEYDLTFRLVVAGWNVRVFDDLHVEHAKTARSRNPAATLFYDVRNNLRIVARYLPPPYDAVYRHYWLERYRWLAERNACIDVWHRGVRAARWRCVWERWTHRSRRLSAGFLERFFRWGEVEERMRGLSNSGVRRIVLAGFGKNIFAFHRGADQAGLTVAAIGDDRFSAAGRRFRGAPVLALRDALDAQPDAVVVGDMSTVHAAMMRDRVLSLTGRPVHDWFGRPEKGLSVQRFDSTARVADEVVVRPIIAC